ncbi:MULTISPECIES: ABC transporter ATP-binding protein [unclassified Chelatococcus]|uniref:ABC transporter ATP-binding protein n=1 Tax=unclassified Chelatococcus TaxID=2638111 RepID=UPI001BCF6587|nr:MULTISPECIES: ABC transporter ATP-binding protein [unclassified Chelatococcus]MBS7699855.1 ABC transporter ATP-binding protein [Chelatococcus sp. YT9]MBX3558799.1 ABC transporter ATP-binding protein [Chelatococcus sp.]
MASFAFESPRKPILKIEGVNKTFQNQHVLQDLNLEIAEGEFLTLLGPSGCGKTTTLNMVAGFLQPDSGNLFLRGLSANTLPPQKRRLGMVFQSWALFPHMSVFDNVAYGLRMRGFPGSEIPTRVTAMLEMVRLSSARDKFPSQLSGGMQQRVALARALVTEPDLLLLDEPLSNLDAALRKDMQVEIKRIHERLKVTTLLVTHSQEEALVMSDRIAVMRGGRIERIASPHAIYTDPHTAFVCTFVGDANVFDATIESISGSTAVLRVGSQRILAPRAPRADGRGSVQIAIRPENVAISRVGNVKGDNVLEGTVEDTIFKGNNITYEVDVAGHKLHVLDLPKVGQDLYRRKDHVSLAFSRESVIILDGERSA